MSAFSSLKPSVDNDSVRIVTDDSIAIFSAQTGKWAAGRRGK
jgi:hypothetical protein